jgi:uncharacterized lipoprotein NlpE involved in copper resistance
MMNKSRLAALAAAAILVLAACNNDAEPTPDPQLAFCDSAASLGAAVVNFRALDAQDTITDIQTSGQAVQAAFQALKTSAGNLAESQASDIESAVADLQSAVGSIPDSDTVDQALASLAPQVEALTQAINDAGDTNCKAVLIQTQASTAVDQAQAAAASMAADASAAAGEAQAAVESMRPAESPAS